MLLKEQIKRQMLGPRLDLGQGQRATGAPFTPLWLELCPTNLQGQKL